MAKRSSLSIECVFQARLQETHSNKHKKDSFFFNRFSVHEKSQLVTYLQGVNICHRTSGEGIFVLILLVLYVVCTCVVLEKPKQTVHTSRSIDTA